VYYSVFNKKKARREAAIFDSDGNIESMKLLWNITESKLLRKLLPITFASINFHQIIFIPRLFSHVLDPQAQPLPQTDQNPQSLETSKPYQTQDPSNSRIKIRILSSTPLPKLQQTTQKSSLFRICLPNNLESRNFEKLVIHFHGGGYIGQTSFSHQNYTREWANNINEPIFSVDYRLAPENPYPDSFDDAWQAYTWLVNYSYEHLGVSSKKIILVGDSAGGHLLACLSLKCLESGFRPPDAIFMIYPGLSLKIEHISKGALLSLDDQMLSNSIFYVVREAYLQGKHSVDEFFVSPSHCPGELLENFPKTEMIITMNDPLFGDSMRFADRLIRHGREVHITEYPDGIHGALSFANDQGIPMFTRILDDSIRILKGLLE
jgi:hormone-sensitive lipase